MPEGQELEAEEGRTVALTLTMNVLKDTEGPCTQVCVHVGSCSCISWPALSACVETVCSKCWARAGNTLMRILQKPVAGAFLRAAFPESVCGGCVPAYTQSTCLPRVATKVARPPCREILAPPLSVSATHTSIAFTGHSPGGSRAHPPSRLLAGLPPPLHQQA